MLYVLKKGEKGENPIHLHLKPSPGILWHFINQPFIHVHFGHVHLFLFLILLFFSINYFPYKCMFCRLL